MLFQRYGIWLFLAFLLAGCDVKNTENETRLDSAPLSGAQSFWLTPADQKKTVELAEAGDSDAAFRLYQHFSFACADQKNGLNWLKKAAEMGNEKAKQHLRVIQGKE